MKLTEALSGSSPMGAERCCSGCGAIIHRSRNGYQLTRYELGEQGRSRSQSWIFSNLYDLLIFARTQGFAEVDAGATDWRAVSGSA